MNALATSLQTYFTTFAHSQRDLSSNTIGSYRDTWRMLLKYLTATLGVTADALDRMTDGAMTVTRLLERNVRDVTWQDARAIYEAAF
jgi:alcohol dehydrogenase class IV